MGDRDVLDVERPEPHAPARGDLDQLDFGRARLRQAPRLQEADGEAGGVDRDAQARPKVDQGPDMVLVGMGDEDAEEVLALAFEEAQVRHDDVDAGHVLAGEGDAAIDQDPLAPSLRPEAVEGAVEADLAQASERDEHEFVLGRRHVRSYLAGSSAGTRAVGASRYMSAASIRSSPDAV